MKDIRLDKYLADMGIGTRSEIKKYIKGKLVKVNGLPALKSDIKVRPGRDFIEYRNKSVEYIEYYYYLLNKPAGVVSAVRDNIHKTVIELIPDSINKKLFPVGRLDIDTEGLFLITNDGQLSHNLLAPGKHVDKTYYAKIDGLVNDSTVSAFLEGLDIGEKKNTLPAKLNIIKIGSISEVEITVCEGKYHQIKRMFEAVGMKVVYLKRISFGGIILDDNLALGQCRQLTEDEISILKGNNYVI